MAPSAGGSERGRIREHASRPRTRLLLGAIILLGILVFVWYRLDWQRVIVAIVRADLRLLAVGTVAATVGLACWSEAMRYLLPPDAGPVSRRRGFLVYATGTLVRRTMPLGYAGSMGVLAYLFGREASFPIDRSLASVSAAEFLNMVASTAVTVTGVLLLVVLGPPSPAVSWLGLGALAVVIASGLSGVLLLYRRESVVRIGHGLAAGLSSFVRRIDGRVPRPLPVEAAERRIEGFVGSLSTISSRRWAVAITLGYSLVAWAAFVAALYASGLAVGVRIPIPVAMVLVPVGGYASILPIPGGLGGYELGVAGGIALLSGIDVATALAVTLLFRVCTYWFLIGVGLASSAALSIDLRLLARATPDGVEEEPDAGAGSSDR